MEFWKRSQDIPEGHPAQRYLASRSLWPLLPGENLRCGMRHDHDLEEDFFYLIAELADHEGRLRAIQYLRLNRQGEPAIADDGHKDRVTIGPAKNCAVWPVTRCPPRVGVAEGLETAMAVRRLYGIPCFATLGAKFLGSFRPPFVVEDLVIFADHDKPGIAAAIYLHDRLVGLGSFGERVPTVTIRRPVEANTDFADLWESQQ